VASAIQKVFSMLFILNPRQAVRSTAGASRG
jgi:hypothetical protein